MKKIVIHKPGGYDRLVIEEHPDPVPGPDEVMIEVQCTCMPFSAPVALMRAWSLRRAGDEAAADAVIAACRKFGTAVPYNNDE